MKYRMIIKADQKEMFEVFQENFRNEYFMEKGKILPVEKMVNGFTFQKNVSMDKRKGHIRLATVKLLDFIYPRVYKVEYVSDRYRKVTGISFYQMSDGQLEIILEEIMDKVVTHEGGKVEYINEIPESDTIKKASFWKKFQYKYLARSIQLKKKENKKKK